MPVLSALKSIILGASPETRAERKLLTKIDTFVLSFLCLVYWSNYLNRSNLQFAYVSGMKESIGLEGNDYTLATTVFYVGFVLFFSPRRLTSWEFRYTVGQIPHSFAIQYLPARIWFPLMGADQDLGNTQLRIINYQNPGQLYAIRFIQALAESSTFSGAHWLLGSWYKDSELGKRSALFACFAQIGSLFSGFMQGAIYTSLHKKLGKEGGNGLLSLVSPPSHLTWPTHSHSTTDGLIALLIALYGLIIFPNTPQTTSAFYSHQKRNSSLVPGSLPDPERNSQNEK
ncbi:Major Facilitator Superfamily [Rhizoctonia solani]|uniref:Major Facilitator Superfamily n=1 Tax=Rhizoctonia solani TaxID=456999 RepID=A0A8H7M8Y3_9AGAM|nr:Major Facilitator Superfamily [Rhizoctonia solani]